MGRFSDEGWRVRKDGSTFWASVVITALRNPNEELRGFAKVTRDLTERRALEERTQKRNRELQIRMNQLTESRNQLEVRSLELQRLSAELVRVQDQEHRRVARELHDDLGQILVALKMNLDTAKDFTPRGDAIELTELALAKVRNLSFVLHPPLLDESGLLPALHLYIEGFKKRSTLRITLTVSRFPSLAFPPRSKPVFFGSFKRRLQIFSGILEVPTHTWSFISRRIAC
jgi:signal transduction histidine kinase